MDKRVKQAIANETLFYKASKSQQSYTTYFHEDFFYEYKEYSKNYANHNYGISTCGNLEKLCGCCIYGDQLTQIIIDKENPYFEELKQSLRVNDSPSIREKYAEIVSDFVVVGRNISLKDPYVLKDIFKHADRQSLFTFFRFEDEANGEKIEDVYRKLGFEESYDFVTKVRQSFKDNIVLNDDFAAFRANLEEFLPYKEGCFTFEAEKKNYEKIKLKLFKTEPKIPVKNKNAIVFIKRLFNKKENNKSELTEFQQKIYNFIKKYNEDVRYDDIDIKKVLDMNLTEKTFNRLIEHYNNGNSISGLFLFCDTSKEVENILDEIDAEQQIRERAMEMLGVNIIGKENIDEELDLRARENKAEKAEFGEENEEIPPSQDEQII